jgi:mannopine transport system ATP-binding protein
MAPGRIAQVDTPERLYDAPASRYVADFVGKINFVEAELTAVTHNAAECRLLGVEGPAPMLRCATRAALRPGDRVTVGIRPEHVTARPGIAEAGRLQGHIEKTRFVGSYQFVSVRLGPTLSVIVADPQRVCVPGKDCVVEVDESRVVLFPDHDRDPGPRGIGV